MYRVEDLQPDDCILVEGHGPLAAIIKWATDNPFSHVAQVGHGVLIEAVETVQTAPLNKYCNVGWRLTPLVTQDIKESAIAWSMGKLGQPYGIDALLADGARTILHLPIMTRLNPHAFVCSGMYELAHESRGVVLCYAPLLTPADLSYSGLLSGPRPWWMAGLPASRRPA